MKEGNKYFWVSYIQEKMINEKMITLYVDILIRILREEVLLF